LENVGKDIALSNDSYCEKLEIIEKFALAIQLFKSGTSISANIMGAQNEERKAGFIYTVKKALKEG
jgi:four helix bundle protein